MSKLSIIPLGEIIQFQRGFDLPTSQRVEGECPVISSSGFTGTHQDFKCEGENVITGRYGTIGEVYYYNGKCWPLNTALFVKDFKGNIPQYVYYLLKHVLKVDGKDKSTVPGVDRNVLHMMKVRFQKDLVEQQKIVDVLSVVDKKIEVNNKINDTLQQQANDIYMHLFFGREVNGKIYNILIENEKSSIQVGEAKTSNGEYPFFTSGEAILEWNEALVDGRNCFLNTGGNADVKFYVGKAAYSTDTWCITAKNELSDYLYLLLNSIKVELNKKFFQGTGLKHLQKELLKDRPIYIPNKKEIKSFNEVINPILNMISEKTRENQELSDLRDWLLPMLMNGQATVE